MDKARSRLHRGIVIALYISDIPCHVKGVPFGDKSDIVALVFEVVAVAFDIIEIFPEIVIPEKCFDISALTVADDIEMIIFLQYLQRVLYPGVEYTAVRREI